MKIFKNLLILMSFTMSSLSYGEPFLDAPSNQPTPAALLLAESSLTLGLNGAIYGVPVMSPSVHQSADGLSFTTGLSSSPETCRVKTEEELKIIQLAESVGNLSCGLSARGSSTDYCKCIDGKKRSEKSKKQKGHLKKLAKDLYASALASKLNNALVSYFKNAELVGYGQATSDSVGNAIDTSMKNYNSIRNSKGLSKYPSCSPKNLEKMLGLLNSNKNKEKKGCLGGAVSEKSIKVLKNKLKEQSVEYNKLKEISFDESDNVLSIGAKLDETISASFASGMMAQEILLSNIYKSKDAVENPSAYRDAYERLQKRDFLKLEEISRKISDLRQPTMQEYKFIADIYKKNPLLRSLNPIPSFDAAAFGPSLMFNKNSINSNSFEVQNKLKGFALKSVHSQIGQGPLVLSKEPEQLYLMYLDSIGEVAVNANQECMKAFADVEKFCSQDPWKYIMNEKPSELSKVLNDIYLSDEDSLSDAIDAHVDAGYLYCSLYECQLKENKNVRHCDKPEETDGNFTLDSVMATDSQLSGRSIVDGEFGRGELSGPISVTELEELSYVEFSPGAEADYRNATDIVDSSQEEYHAATGFEQAASTAFSNSSAMTALPKSDFSSFASSSAASDVAIGEEAVANDLAQVQAANADNTAVMNELKKVQEELAKSKNEMESTKKELEELKAKEALAEQQRINDENERKLQNTINSLEDKIAKLEKKEASLASTPTNKKVKYSNPMNTKGNSLATSGAEQSEGTVESSQGVVSTSSGSNFSRVDSISSSKDTQNVKNALKRLEESRSQAGIASGGGLSILSAKSLDDPSLQTKVREAYQNGIETIYVNVGGNVYRISPMKDAKGNIVEEDGTLKFITEIATTSLIEQDELAAANTEELKRLPASVTDEPVLNPEDPAYRKAQLDALLNSAEGEK
ncbi:hypothetical protein [Bacteriovorax sp. Seq25_V]|uniref:hypothetical protein n=1 Tax=Bacteriovorax sp. Seq25_V TaxID=1201288 RepID=UPI00038A2BAC|nr:hypothetical protein [Bacteriovorax sp. Seq25_V]EQC44064.1 hypothetical protein M900_1144 [Bacteriovorax sp. Seq25_V]